MGIRCSDECAEFEGAVCNAKALVKALGTGWVPRVWENSGWHFAAVTRCGRMKIHVREYRNYTRYIAYLGEADDVGGVWVASGDTPQTAAQAVLDIARTSVEDLQLVVNRR